MWDWEAGRLSFEQLLNRLHRRGAPAVRVAEEWPAQFVAFDLLRISGTDTTAWPYMRRRAALEELFTTRGLSAPWVLCPSTTDPHMVHEWLTWGSVRIEGVVFKRLNDPYRPSVEAGASTSRGRRLRPSSAPSPAHSPPQVRFCSAATTLTAACTTWAAPPPSPGRPPLPAAALLAPAGSGHPWTGWMFSAGWGSRQVLDVTLVVPDLVVEVGVDVARDAGGRWRHPARFHRSRPDLRPENVERWSEPPA
ncbi:ATP-dependent DNA ligase [Streptomyces sp. 2231.1]|uniref:ATP-dependent DNA ligase n=1 Tax=Streptomyces sp. 2231.1 TaxID=1855347 RepID=UPI000ACA2291|nr:ATP-dependent DNA ligase [Streptomyces sp. 2231.1]